MPSDEARVRVGCVSCAVRADLPTTEAASLASAARSFFARHGGCLTTVDLGPYRSLMP